MNARRFDHYLGFWNRVLAFAAEHSRTPSTRKVARAKATLRRLGQRRRAARG